ncbi:MAG: flagellar export chaperone FliS [Pseudomonadota bacterium]
MSASQNAAMQEYQQVGVFSEAAYADPHQLITMLMEGALERIALAKGALLQKDIAEKGRLIGNTVTIIEGLRGCLDMPVGGELAQNLADLYDYMIRQLLRANLESEPELLDEVAQLLREIKTAWEDIPNVHSTSNTPEAAVEKL